MSADSTTEPPEPDAFQSIYEYLRASDDFRDARTPSQLDTLSRAERLDQQSFQAVERQIVRIRKTDFTRHETQPQAMMDAQFLLAALWRLRLAACIAASTEPSTDGPVTAAIASFDAQLPDLTRMRHVAQHLDEYAVDHLKRRQKKPGTNQPVGRRMLEVETISEASYQWLGRTIDFDVALNAGGLLMLEIHSARLRAQRS